MAIQSKEPKKRQGLQRKKPLARSEIKKKGSRKKQSDLREWVNSLGPKTQRKNPTRKKRGEITGATYTEMLERDDYRCVHCGARDGEQANFKGVPFRKRLEGHHILFRSQLGTGDLRNAATACGPPTQSGTCHHWAHTTRAGRRWFEDWRDTHLDDQGRTQREREHDSLEQPGETIPD